MRHLLNLATGLSASYYASLCVSTPFLWYMCALCRLTTAAYHGAHCLGFERFANNTLMPIDVAVVSSTVITIAYERYSIAAYVAFVAFAFIVWLATFTVWSGAPFNVILSILHMSVYIAFQL